MSQDPAYPVPGDPPPDALPAWHVVRTEDAAVAVQGQGYVKGKSILVELLDGTRFSIDLPLVVFLNTGKVKDAIEDQVRAHLAVAQLQGPMVPNVGAG